MRSGCADVQSVPVDPGWNSRLEMIKLDNRDAAAVSIEQVTTGAEPSPGGTRWIVVLYRRSDVSGGRQLLAYTGHVPVGAGERKIIAVARDVVTSLADWPVAMMTVRSEYNGNCVLWDQRDAGWHPDLGPPEPDPETHIDNLAAVVADKLRMIASQNNTLDTAIVETIITGPTATPGRNWMIVLFRTSQIMKGRQLVGWGGYVDDDSMSAAALDRMAVNLWERTIVEPPGSELPRENLDPTGIAWWRGRASWTADGPPDATTTSA